MAFDGVDGGCNLVTNFVIGPDYTRATDDFLLDDRLLAASEALLCTMLVDLLCWERADEDVGTLCESVL